MKNSSQDNSNNKKGDTDTADVDNVDKIRDILFGNQMRDFDHKFNQLEQRLASDIDNLRKENSLQIESLQTFIESEIEILSSKITHEEKSRIEGMDDLDDLLKKNIKQLDKKLADLGGLLDTQARDTNQKMLKQSQDFNIEMNNQSDALRKRIEDYKEVLSKGKVDKSILAEVFNNLALQINDD